MDEKLNKVDYLGFCEKCPKKETCKNLCKKAEKYVNQDWYDFGTYDFINIKDAENLPDYKCKEEIPWGGLPLSDNKRKEYKIRQLLKDGLTFREIQYHIDCSRDMIGRISKEIRN